MLKVLLRSLPDLRVQLTRAVETMPRPLIVAQEHEESSGGAFDRRQPYRYLLEHEAPVSILVVADDPVGGLWRDPIGDLAEKTFQDRRTAAEAATGYLLFFERAKPDFVRRDLWDRYADVAALILRLKLQIPLPPRATEPIKKKKSRARPAADEAHEPTHRGTTKKHQTGPRRPAPPPGHKATRTEPEFEAPSFADEDFGDPEVTTPHAQLPIVPVAAPDPFAVLGLKSSATEGEVKQAFRALIVQYHPDKVAHLAPEFQVLAESRSRELTEAYEQAQKQARHEDG